MAGEQVTVRLEGPLTAPAVAARLPGPLPGPGAALRLELAEVDEVTPAGLAALVDAIAAARRGGARVVVESPPLELAHVLYKAGHLRGGDAVALEGEVPEGPFAG